jgi:GntR family transcriptional regulator
MTFTHEMTRAGRVPSSRILAQVLRPSSPTEALSLGIPLNEPIVHLRRLRLADGQPIAIESTILINSTANAVMSAELAKGSLHEALRAAGFVLRRGSGTISAAAATADDARLLAVRPAAPLLVEQRVIEDTHGRRIEATESRYAASRYGLEVRFDVEGPDLDVIPG